MHLGKTFCIAIFSLIFYWFPWSGDILCEADLRSTNPLLITFLCRPRSRISCDMEITFGVAMFILCCIPVRKGSRLTTDLLWSNSYFTNSFVFKHMIYDKDGAHLIKALTLSLNKLINPTVSWRTVFEADWILLVITMSRYIYHANLVSFKPGFSIT